jgi:hypothetical protein
MARCDGWSKLPASGSGRRVVIQALRQLTFAGISPYKPPTQGPWSPLAGSIMSWRIRKRSLHLLQNQEGPHTAVIK